ncbi:MAG: yycI [Bacillales bacterium]|nr:yycI [Bacillales bacterium]
MDWSKTKTLFIIIFLILDIFLFYQYWLKKSSNQLDYLTEVSIENNALFNEQQMEDLPKLPMKISYISGRVKKFSKNEVENLKKQDIKIINEIELVSTIKPPFLKYEGYDSYSFKQFLNEFVYRGGIYEFWEFNEEENIVILNQTYGKRLIYQNQNSKLKIKLDSDGNIIGYSQTMLDDIKEIANNKNNPDLLSATKALEVISNNVTIAPNSKITDIKICFSTLVPLETGTQVLAPTWYVKLNDTDEYLVNAIEGHIITDQELQWSEAQ